MQSLNKILNPWELFNTIGILYHVVDVTSYLFFIGFPTKSSSSNDLGIVPESSVQESLTEGKGLVQLAT